jgi:predicted metal-dependent hydrolase
MRRGQHKQQGRASRACARVRAGANAADLTVPAVGDLPAYTLRTSRRARHVRLTVTPRDGLVVVVPAGLRGFDPAPVLRDRAAWIAEATAHFAERRSALTAEPAQLLPTEVAFAATSERWRVEQRATGSATVRVRETEGVLALSGATCDAEACLAALRRWLQSAARERLLALLAEQAAANGLLYARASVRGQRARWGSCSARGSITLNRCLLFLPPELARSVALHELAHLAQPNHSRAFWGELERLDPEARRHQRTIARAWDAVPPWAEP